MNRLKLVLLITLLLPQISGCLSVSPVEVEAADDFNWEAMKRHNILMTPLLDLRTGVSEPGKDTRFEDQKTSVSYAEKFKQAFFKLRNDIRVFGEGGAFEHVSSLPNLTAIARSVIAKQPVSATDVKAISDGSQDIRFVFFYAITDEKLKYDVSYHFREDREYDEITYYSMRVFTLKMALWDVQQNRTVWIGKQVLTPTESNSSSVRNPSKTKREEKQKDGSKKIYWKGYPLLISLANERATNPSRFPAFPGRTTALEGSFDDFTLSLPIKPDEVDMLESKYFVYHMPLAAMNFSQIGTSGQIGLELGSSSIIQYRYRLGGALLLPMSDSLVEYAGEKYRVSEGAVAMSFDMEWRPLPKLRLMTGLLAGFSVFDIKLDDQPDRAATVEEEEKSQSDGTVFLWPRTRLIFGSLAGFQWGTGFAYRYRYGLEEDVLKTNQPSVWSVELFLGGAFRGF